MGKSPLSALQADLPLVLPSLLASDFANMEREIRSLEAAGARMLHLDVMDGHFVPNISFGVPVVEAIRRTTDLLLDVHLMISEPDRYVEPFRRAGADALTFHVEVVADPVPLLEKIRNMGAAAGISLNPSTPVPAIEKCLDHCDLVLTMSVMPGFGGQHFQPGALEKLRWLRERVSPGTLLSVDGGVNDQTVGPCAEAGAGLFVIGTALFDHPDYRHRLAELTTLARSSLGLRV
jgi:ribulose-phosphate 3-epimerase